jgi:polysaccharide deacetylase 2 family uncharacterized protein YibQ
LGKLRGTFWIPAFAGMTLAFSALAAVPAGDPLSEGIARGHMQWHRARAVAPTAAISIIIDDMGQQRGAGLRAIDLPGDVALSFLPGTDFAHSQAELAFSRGKEVMLHLPMEPGGNARAFPTSINHGTLEPQLQAFFEEALASVPHARGVNNHQGSLMTELITPMNWLMSAIKKHPGLYFVDSRTSGATVAYRAALAHQVPAGERSVFLDDDRNPAAIRAQFHLLLERAHQSGRALAIGHPNIATLDVLEEELPRLPAYGVRLVPPSELIAGFAGLPPPYKHLKLIETLAAPPAAVAPPSPEATAATLHTSG